MKKNLKWILKLTINLLPMESIIDLIIKTLKELVKKTPNKLDDGCVEIVAELLYTATNQDKKDKLEHLDEQFE